MATDDDRLSDLIYDWNQVGREGPFAPQGVQLLDETLRDGIQCPSVVHPSVDDKVHILRLMDSLGIHAADLGLPGAGRRAAEDVERLLREIVDGGLSVQPACAARTVLADLEPAVEIAQRVGASIEVMTFIGSSPIRQYVEDWDIELLARRTAEAADFVVGRGLPCTFVTEDTTRSRPETLQRLYGTAIDHGATRLCLCDTVGHATPDGVRSLVDFARRLIDDSGADVRLDWHGHDDRGLALENALWAVEHGADRVHGTALGIGERVGNTPLDLLLLNLRLLGAIDSDLSDLLVYCKVVARALGWRIPKSYPLSGEDAFRTATGVHAAAILKAEERGDLWLADRVYSGVPASLFGRRQEIEIGPMSGLSNVIHWLRERRLDPEPALVQEVHDLAKRTNRILTDEEVQRAVARYRERVDGSAAPPTGRR